MGGCGKEKICSECTTKPLIKGKSWAKHCIDHHQGNKNVKWE